MVVRLLHSWRRSAVYTVQNLGGEGKKKTHKFINSTIENLNTDFSVTF